MFNFAKIQGCGNSFVAIYDQHQKIRPVLPSLAQQICHRHFGLGTDGFVLLEPSSTAAAAFQITYLNSDGSIGDLCGNGLRCAARYGYEMGLFTRNTAIIETAAGFLPVYRIDQQLFRVAIPQKTEPQFDLDLSLPTSIFAQADFINTGVPHLIVEVQANQIDHLDVHQWGAKLRAHPQFAPQGTNVNFISRAEDQKIMIRTFERGVEAETLSCGTGAVAAALIVHHRFHQPSPITLKTRGGEMKVDFQLNQDQLTNIFLSGPTMIIAQGQISLDWLQSYFPNLN